jgi:hypothetical protein
MVDFEVVEIEKEEDVQLIIGHAGFIKAAEDLYEAMLNAVPGVKFGVGFAEASGKRLVRTEGNDNNLESLVAKNLLKINAGHTFMILFKGAYPINVVRHIKEVNEVVNIYCATANPTKVIMANDKKGRAIVGIIDGQCALGIEKEEDKKERHEFLRKIGYKK